MSDENTSQTPADGAAPAKPKKKAAKKVVKKVAKKAAKKSAKTKGKVGRGGHPQEFKDKVIAFVNADPVRGIKAKAVKKFGVTSITLDNWLKAAGIKVDAKGGKALKKAAKGSDKPNGRGRPKGSGNKATTSKKSSGSPDTFENLVEQIRTTKAHLKDLVARLAGAV